MTDHREAFDGIDSPKLRHAVAVTEAGGKSNVRFLGKIDNTPEATRKLIAKLTK